LQQICHIATDDPTEPLAATDEDPDACNDDQPDDNFIDPFEDIDDSTDPNNDAEGQIPLWNLPSKLVEPMPKIDTTC